MSIHPLGRPTSPSPTSPSPISPMGDFLAEPRRDGAIDLTRAFGGIATADGGRPPGLPLPPTHTSMAAVDICAFTRRRYEDVQLHLRDRMYQTMADAFAMTGLPWAHCYREDRGDGMLVILPPSVVAEALLDPLVNHTSVLLRRDNRLASEAARLRLRLAVHVGDVHRDPNGVAGHDVNLLFRLLEAGAFKKHMDDAGADLGLIVSERLFETATHRAGLVDADAYRPIKVRRKETRTRAWIWLPPRRRPGDEPG